MINPNAPCLIARERDCARYEGPEQVFQHYLKSGRAYFLHTFFGVRFWLYAFFTGFALLLLFLDYDFFTETLLWRCLSYFFVGIGPVAYIIETTIKVWFWQYSRHVIVSNHGIWIMGYSTFWWSQGFDGKKHLFSPHWSLYAWEELNAIFTEQSTVSKLFGLQDFVIDRWDGEQIVRYLKADEVTQICAYATQHIPAHKRKEARDKKPGFWDYFWRSFGIGRKN